MTLRIQVANAPVLDADRLFHCTVVKVKPLPGHGPYASPRYEWTLEGKGTIRAYGVKFTTPCDLGMLGSGYTLDVDVEEHEDSEEMDVPYNPLARTLLAFELVTPQDLEPDHLETTLATLDLESALGLCVVCQLAKRTMTIEDHGIARKVPFIAPILETLVLDKDATECKPRKRVK